jgi:hypothetical protein
MFFPASPRSIVDHYCDEVKGSTDGATKRLINCLEQQTCAKGITNGSVRSTYLDWTRLARTMKYPKIVFGSSACLDTDILKS